MKKYKAAVAIIAISAASGANAQGILGQISGFLDKVAPKSTITTAPQAPVALVEPSAEQTVMMHQLVQGQDLPSGVAETVAEASPLIERVIRTSACGINDTAWHSLNRVRENPRTFNGFPSRVARLGDQYHNSSQCHDVLKLVDFSKPAANALSFTAYFISPSSERASNQKFTLIKQNGNWLIKDIYYAHS